VGADPLDGCGTLGKLVRILSGTGDDSSVRELLCVLSGVDGYEDLRRGVWFMTFSCSVQYFSLRTELFRSPQTSSL
jgi:hypothetical protein